MTMATLTLMTSLMLIATAHGESILRTNYGFSVETLDTQVYFARNDSRIVLYYTLTKMETIAEKAPNKSVRSKKCLEILAHSIHRKHIWIQFSDHDADTYWIRLKKFSFCEVRLYVWYMLDRPKSTH